MLPCELEGIRNKTSAMSFFYGIAFEDSLKSAVKAKWASLSPRRGGKVCVSTQTHKHPREYIIPVLSLQHWLPIFQSPI